MCRKEILGALINVEFGGCDSEVAADAENRVSEHDMFRTFSLYKEVLAFCSGYFAAVIDSPRFVETQDGVVKLPPEDPITFKLFAHWLYTRRVYERTLAREVLMDFLELAKLWVFGDTHDMLLLQNDTILIFIRR